MKKLKAQGILILAACLLLTACTGPAGGSSSSSSSSGSSPSGSSSASGTGGSAPDSSTGSGPEKYTLPLVEDGSVTISIAIYENYLTGYPYSSGLPVWERLQEETGVKIDWQTTPSSDYATVMKTRLASGTDLPDFINIPGDAMRYVSDGVIIPITEQMEKYGYYTNQLFEANPYLRPFVTGPDGELYFFTSDVAGTSLSDPYAFMIRKDWLEKFNLSEPETLDDWYQCWKTFLEQDANGNGQRDEIPFCNDNQLKGLTGFGEAFGLYTHASEGWSVNDQGVVEYDYVKPEMKELLAWLNKCYSEDLIDKEFATQGTDVIMKKVSSNQSGGVFRFLNGLDTYNKALQSAGIDGEYIAVKPPKASADSKLEPFVERYGPVSGLYGFTKDCKDLDIKFKFIDYAYASETGNFGTCFGEEGVGYELKDGKPVFTDYVLNNPDGKSTSDALRSMGAMPTFPWCRSLNGYWSYQPTQTIAHQPNTVAAAEMMQPYIRDSFPQNIPSTEEEQSIIGQYMTDITTLRDEMVTKFIMGRESLDQFDTFVNDLQQIGLDKVLQVRQAQYDRYKSLQ